MNNAIDLKFLGNIKTIFFLLRWLAWVIQNSFLWTDFIIVS